MNLQQRTLEIGLRGADVALLHRELGELGIAIDDREVADQAFGASTKGAVADFQRAHSVEATGRVDEATARAISVAVDELDRFVVSGRVRRADGEPLEGVTVRAVDRYLRTEELLGETVTAAGGRYRIAYRTRGEGGTADLMIRVFDAGVELGQSTIRFHAPQKARLEMVVQGRPDDQRSEYERLHGRLAPVLAGIEPADLTGEEVDFLVKDTGEKRDRVRLLAEAARLGRAAGIPAEAGYGFGRQGLPTEVDGLLDHDPDKLRTALEAAVDQALVPGRLREQLDEIMTTLARLQDQRRSLKRAGLAAYEMVGRLVDQDGGALGGWTVRGTDLDAAEKLEGAGPSDLGGDITNPDGVFVLVYAAPPELGQTPDARRRLRLTVLDPDGAERHKQVVRVSVVQRKPHRVRVTVPADGDPTSTLEGLTMSAGLAVPQPLLDDLAGRGIRTLADVRRAGGLATLNMPDGDPAVHKVDAHASLSAVTSDAGVGAALMKKGYASPGAIAAAPRTQFVRSVSSVLGDFDAARLQVAATTWNGFVNSVLLGALGGAATGTDDGLLSKLKGVDKRLRPLSSCNCPDCQAAVSPLAYLADLLDYTLRHVKDGGTPVTRQFLTRRFRQRFAALPASCEQVDRQVRQVRICIEALRAELADPAPSRAQQAALDAAERAYRLAAYTTLLGKLGTSYQEVRLAATAVRARRAELADRLGIELGPLTEGTRRPNDQLDELLLDVDGDEPGRAALTEEALELLFGLAATNRDPLNGDHRDAELAGLDQQVVDLGGAAPLDSRRVHAARPGPRLRTWQRDHLRTVWREQDWPADLPSGGRPLIDPDVIGPDDFRMPTAKAAAADPDRPFDLWLRRYEWVGTHLETLRGRTRIRNGRRVPDLAGILRVMRRSVTYPDPTGTVTVKAWKPTTKRADFPDLARRLARGADPKAAEAARKRIADDLRLTPEAFTRLVEIDERDTQAAADPRVAPVDDASWAEVRSILVQAQKAALFEAWRAEEQRVGVRLGPADFWVPARPPVEGEWPPRRTQPLIDPGTVTLADLPEPTVGATAIKLWHDRQARMEQVSEELAAAREAKGLDAMLRLALGHPNPGDQLEPGLDLDQIAGDKGLRSVEERKVAKAEKAITLQLHLTVESFTRLMTIRANAATGDLARRPTVAEWAEVAAILTRARTKKHEFPTWTMEEDAGVVDWAARKAKLPRWRGGPEARGGWERALQIRSGPPLIDSDLIGLPDLQDPREGRPAYDRWLAHRKWVDDTLQELKTVREGAATPAAGLDAIVHRAVGVPVDELVALAAERGRGVDITARLAQLGLTTDAFAYLVRMHELAAGGSTVLESEWDGVYAILTQVGKLRRTAEWREQEKASGLLLSPDYFRLRPPPPPAFPPPAAPTLLPWRATQAARRAWEATLRARLDQEQAVTTGLLDAVDATEEATLPALRDALVTATSIPAGARPSPSGVPPDSLAAKAEWVTKRLLIDAAVGGCQKTTRVTQAIETLHSLLLGIRTRQLQHAHPNLVLDADAFDEEWAWLGSYATWRAAMFVHLYPDNLLEPTLRRWQTPAFRQLAAALRGDRRLTPAKARKAAGAYLDHFIDVCTLRLAAACYAPVGGAVGDRTPLHLFAIGGRSGRVYWSSYDPDDLSEYAQTFWNTVPGLDDTIRLVGAVPYQSGQERWICVLARTQGAGGQTLSLVKYDLQRGLWREPIELELPKQADGEPPATFTAVAKQRPGMDDSPHVAVRLADGSVWGNQLDRTLDDWADDAWALLLAPRVGQQNRFFALYAMVASGPGEFYLLVGGTTTVAGGNGGADVVRVEVFYRLFGRRDDGRWRALYGGPVIGAVPWPGTPHVLILQRDQWSTVYRFLKGPSGQLQSQDIKTIDDLENWLQHNAGVSLKQLPAEDPLYSSHTLYDLLVGSAIKLETQLAEIVQSLQEEAQKWPKEGRFAWKRTQLEESAAEFAKQAAELAGTRRENVRQHLDRLAGEWERRRELRDWKFADDLVKQLSKLKLSLPEAILRIYGYPTEAHRQPVAFPSRPGPEETEYSALAAAATGLAFLAPTSGDSPRDPQLRFAQQKDQGQTGITIARYLRTGDSFAENAPVRAMPDVPSGPFDLDERWSASQLQLRAGMIAAVFKANEGSPAWLRTYLEELWYFAPVQLALQLQARGHYTAALDWFRTVYDYGAPAGRRKLYPGLVQEESLSALSAYARARHWLTDPLNPHAIASTRPGAYTRFTLLSLVRCLLEFADAEFTRDTAESVPRARSLYLTALELLDSPELRQRMGFCDEVIGTLDIRVGDDEERLAWQEIVADLAHITDASALATAAGKIRALMADTGSFRERVERLAAARDAVRNAKAQADHAPTLGAVLDQRDGTLAAAQLALLAEPAMDTAAACIADLAGRSFGHDVAAVTGHSLTALAEVSLPWLRRPAPVGPALDGQVPTVAVSPTHDQVVAGLVADAPMTGLQMVGTKLAYQATKLIPAPTFHFCVPANPILRALRLQAQLNLYKLRSCRNIAGMLRQLEPYAASTDTSTGLPAIGAGGQIVLSGLRRLAPTPYRYPTLIERARQLVGQAQQLEAALLNALERRDAEAYTLLKSRQDIRVARAGVQLQDLRIKEAESSRTLAELQQERAQLQIDHYTDLLNAGLLLAEYLSLDAYWNAAGLQTAGGIASFFPEGGIGARVGAGLAGLGAAASTLAGIQATQASYERRRQEWEFQRSLGDQDIKIGAQQVKLTEDHIKVLGQERVIAELQTDHAEAAAEFIATKFTNVEFYDWLTSVLERVYAFFLQQATATAQLAADQLAFERQEPPPPVIQADYWEASDDSGQAGQDGRGPDRRGLSGSARLLQDIAQLDEHAFKTARRNLQLTKTISLARLAPAEFQRFRETGVMTFATPMTMFDQDFPGHYLRLVSRVRTSMWALIPPTEGIRATLTASRSSRVTLGPPMFQTATLQYGPDLVALSTPRDATGIFELDPQSELRRPFEGIGVDTTWELRLPKAANRFDFQTLADVLITIEYTAQNSFDLRQRVQANLDSTVSADRPFSFRHELTDQWYDLHNPDQTPTPMVVQFSTTRDDFPPNLDELRIQQVVLYIARAAGEPFEVPVTHLLFSEQGGTGRVGGGAVSSDGVISTRRGNASSWMPLLGRSPIGTWELAFPDDQALKKLFQDEVIKDILLVITYRARTPNWPP